MPTDEPRDHLYLEADNVPRAGEPTWESIQVSLGESHSEQLRGVDSESPGDEYTFEFNPSNFTFTGGSLSFPVIEPPRPEETIIRRSRYDLLLDDEWDPVSKP